MTLVSWHLSPDFLNLFFNFQYKACERNSQGVLWLHVVLCFYVDPMLLCAFYVSVCTLCFCVGHVLPCGFVFPCESCASVWVLFFHVGPEFPCRFCVSVCILCFHVELVFLCGSFHFGPMFHCGSLHFISHQKKKSTRSHSKTVVLELCGIWNWNWPSWDQLRLHKFSRKLTLVERWARHCDDGGEEQTPGVVWC